MQYHNIEELNTIKKMFFHFPVLYREVLSFVENKDNSLIVDCTLGNAGHSFLLFLKNKESYFIGIERDQRMISISMDFFRKNQIESILLNKNMEEDIKIPELEAGRFYILNKRFSYLKNIPELQNKVDFLICDLGISMYHLKEDWGFSFRNNNLNMKLDEDSKDILNILNFFSEKDLANIIYNYGQERFAKSIAGEIVKNRPIENAIQLKDIVIKVYAKKIKTFVNPKVIQKTFQAFRIFINDELTELEELLKNLKNIMNYNGIAVFISFHSLEDKLVKNYFRLYKDQGFNVLTRKPITPTKEEIMINPASHSAKMRVIQCKI